MIDVALPNTIGSITAASSNSRPWLNACRYLAGSGTGDPLASLNGATMKRVVNDQGETGYAFALKEPKKGHSAVEMALAPLTMLDSNCGIKALGDHTLRDVLVATTAAAVVVTSDWREIAKTASAYISSGFDQFKTNLSSVASLVTDNPQTSMWVGGTAAVAGTAAWLCKKYWSSSVSDKNEESLGTKGKERVGGGGEETKVDVPQGEKPGDVS